MTTPLGWISTLLPQNLILGWIEPWKRKVRDSAWNADTGGWCDTCSHTILFRFFVFFLLFEFISLFHFIYLSLQQPPTDEIFTSPPRGQSCYSHSENSVKLGKIGSTQDIDIESYTLSYSL